jgi:hypothetical protein
MMNNVMIKEINREKIEKGGRKMKTRDMAKKGLYVGTGAGLVLFALVGLLPGSLIGGVIGLKVVGAVFGGPLGSEILPRIMLALSMITGVMVSAAVCLIGSGMIGYSVGFLMDAVRSREEAAAEAPAAAKK